MTAIDLLKRDHLEVEDLFDKLSDADEDRRRGELRAQLVHALVVHALIEEQHFYPAVREQDTAALVQQSLDDHESVKQLLGRLLRTEVDDDAFMTVVSQLQQEVEAHVLVEENELFPKVLAMLSNDRLEALAGDMKATKAAAAQIDPAEQLMPEDVDTSS